MGLGSQLCVLLQQLRLVALSRPLTPDEQDCLKHLTAASRDNTTSRLIRNKKYRTSPIGREKMLVCKKKRRRNMRIEGRLAQAKLKKGESVSRIAWSHAIRLEQDNQKRARRARLNQRVPDTVTTAPLAGRQVALMKRDICDLIIQLGPEES